MGFIQHYRVLRTPRGEHFFIKEVRDQELRLIRYELLDTTPIDRDSEFYHLYKNTLGHGF